MKKFFIIISMFFLVALRLYAQPRNQVFVGARPLGLGETFVSIADDGNAVYWNPAGLPTLKRFEFNSMYANWFGIQGLRNAYVSFVYPISPRFVLGSSYIHFGLDGDKELEFFRDQAYASFGARVVNNLMLGANVKYLNTDARLDGTSFGKADGLGFDLGALYTLSLKRTKFLKQINFGVMAHDVGGTGVVYTGTENSEKVLSQNIRFGFSLFPPDQLSLKWFSIRDALLAFDFDDRFHVGAEAWPLEHLGVRMGLQKDLRTEEPATVSFGSSLKFPVLSIQMDYAYVIPPTLSSMHVFSFSFVPSVSPVKITDLGVNDLFSSFYKSYATSKIGYVTVRNDYDQELKMTLKVSIPGLTESATHETFVLGPNEQRTSSFPAILSKNTMNVREPEFRQAKVRLEYKIKNEDKFVETSKKFRLFGRGAMTWEDPGKAAAFITKLDRMVELFSREVTKDLPYRSEIELGHLYTAAALFDAMSGLGIKYRQDPENPFSVIPKTQHSVDYVKYPAELCATNKATVMT